MRANGIGNLKQTSRLLSVVHTLRRRCPWDRKQTHKTLIPYLLEEAYETINAIEGGKKDGLREELGDLLLQVALHAEIARERKTFSFEDVASCVTDKMIRRHPHVFGDARARTAEDVKRNWATIKGQEKPNHSLLSGIPKALPALQLAQRYGEISASVGFDWKTVRDVLEKVAEELAELKVEIGKRRRNPTHLGMELGDLLFVLTRLAAHLNIDAERSLRKSCSKFESRFSQMEREIRLQGKHLGDCSLNELEAVWQKVKRRRGTRHPSVIME